MDCSTRWVEAIPLLCATPAACANAFMNKWISHFGMPWNNTSDLGSEFTSALWQAISSSLGTQYNSTTSYNTWKQLFMPV